MKHILRKFLPLVLALALLCALAPAALTDDDDAGGGGGGGDSGNFPANGVTLSSGDDADLRSDGKTPPSYTLNLVSSGKIKNSATLTATVSPAIATNKSVEWAVTQTDDFISWTKSGDNNETITITGLKKGTAKITVTAVDGEQDKNGKNIATATCTVNVTDPVAVTGVKLSAATLNLVSSGEINNIATLTATVSPANATDKNVKWTITPADGCITQKDKTADEEKADPNNLTASFQGVGAGKATITVTTANGKTAECAVTVTDPVSVEGMKLNRSKLSLVAGTTATLTATFTPSDTTNKKIIWSVDGNIFDPEDTSVPDDAAVVLRSPSGQSITVVARNAGTATITATADGDPATTDECDVTVTTPRISISLDEDEDRLEFSGSGLISTLRSYCRNITGSSLNYLTNISVSTAEGTLYEGYVSEADHGEGVSTSMKYYDSSTGANQLSKVVFVPRPGFTGDAVITFTAYSTNGEVFTGSIVVEIPDNPMSYTSEDGLPVRFKVEDFNNYSRTRGYSAIKYVRFELPSSSYGTLYYNYIDSDINEGTVSHSTLYHRAGSPSLDKVWFVPNPNYSGNVTIDFEACDTSGATFDGSLLVQVVNVEGSGDTGSSVYYSVRPGETVYFSTEDFNDLSYDRTDYPVNYIYFSSLPASSRGTLYCSGYGSVRTSQYIYRTGSNRRLLSDLYFTARSSYSGSVSIPFTAYATNGRSFRGTVTITVSSSAASYPTGQGTIYDTDSIITYSSGGEAAAFRSQDFYSQLSRHLSNPLSTVRFYTPDAAQGRLCLNYVSPTSYSVLDSSVDYSLSTLSQISFLPRAGFSGAAYVRFLATDQSGKSYSGMLAVNVTPPSSSSYFDDLRGYSWAAPAADFLARYGIVTGTDYRAFSPAGPTKRGDFILMLQRCFEFQNVGEVGVFTDVSPWSYYGPAIAGAYVAGIAAGDGDGYFRPEDPLTRQEAAVLLYRCMARSGSMPSVTMADIAGFADQAQIADYAQTAMATLVRLGVLTGSGGYLNPTQDLTRAEMALIFHRAMS